ncbi:MAG: hypothetical protein KDD44_09140 [Bdellovibrionales bacterium]|nr:hypothetical protein [Bdellovibrionales bacterium]
MPKKKVRGIGLAFADGAALATVWLLVQCMRYLPRSVADAVATGIVRLVIVFMPRLRAAALRNLERAFPDSSVAERVAIYRKSVRVLAENIADFARIPDLSREAAAELVDYQEFQAVLRGVREAHPGVGVLLPTMHFGSFELNGQLYAILERPLAVLARGFGLPRLDRFWNGRREYNGNRIFSRNGAYREIIQNLSAGSDVTLLCDQNVKRKHAVFVDFFGYPASATKTVALAALRTGAPIVLIAAYRTDPQRLKLLYRRIDVPAEYASQEGVVQDITARLHAAIEDFVREAPHAWFWIHRRWKTRPAGEPETWYDGM